MLHPEPLEPAARPPADAPARPAAAAVMHKPAAAGRRPRWDSAALFAGSDEIEIVHGDALYRMRITSMGKLILTK
ncbi:hypothetical protein CLD22_14555 [Rubrivivax gelatinosus]|nr:hypothetical protein [Rubrivivax gelatinosus]